MDVLNIIAFAVVVVLMFMIWRSIEGIRKALAESNNDDILFAFCDEMTESINVLSASVAEHIDRINLAAVSKDIEAIIGLQERIISSLSTLEGINGTVQKSVVVLQGLADMLNAGQSGVELTPEQQEAITDLRRSIAELTKFAGDIQGIVTMSSGNIESAFNKTDDELRRIIKEATKRIEEDYRDNLEAMFKAMDKNLRAIFERLKK